MKKTLFAAAALVALSVAPAFAGPIDEVAQDRNIPVQAVAAPTAPPGAGRIVNSEIDGVSTPASLEGVRLVSRPSMDNLNHGGGK